MKAIIHQSYGSPEVLQLVEVEKPTPKEDEVLIKMRASSINAMEWHLLIADLVFVRLMGMGLFKPKNIFLGSDLAGEVEAVGSEVSQFRPGDAVFGFSGRHGAAYAEYVCATEKEITHKPNSLSFEQAASLPVAAITALQGLRDQGQIKPGQKVLIQGASGGVGTFAVQLAKVFGAEVTAVCSTKNLELVRRLGADHVIDYKKEDFTQKEQKYDLIFAINGFHPIKNYLRCLDPGGAYVTAGGSMRQIMQAMLNKGRAAGKISFVSARQDRKDLDFLKELVVSGKVTPVIDGCYPLEKTRDAFDYYGKEHAKGKVILTMGAGE
jgi:NADPH:quinone reductase and related Zn-dependent oxidoreductases